MSCLLGIDTGGTYTDAVIVDDATQTVIAKAKALTTRHDLAVGLGAAAGRVIAASAMAPDAVKLVSISTTLATNALVEGQGGRVALVMIGFSPSDLKRADLQTALRGDPVVFLPGGHDVHGREQAGLEIAPLVEQLSTLATTVTGFAVAGYFAVRNPEHETSVRDLIAAQTGLPVTCSHELSSKLDGPRRALTTVLNARLVGAIGRLIEAAERWMEGAGIRAPLMVVRGDGALVSAAFARLRPIETILSGPAASLVGARYLTGADNAIVSDIGGTTTDVAILQDGRPRIDENGATVGGWRTMVDAVAMRTFGLGGDSEVGIEEGALDPQITLGPRRLMPLSLAAAEHGDAVIVELERQLRAPFAGRNDGRFALRTGLPDRYAAGLARQEAELYALIGATPLPLDRLVTSTAQVATLNRLVARGLAHVAGFTPSDAQHVLGRFTHWNIEAARLGAELFARRKDGFGQPIAPGAEAVSARVAERLEWLSAERVLETALAEDGADPALAVSAPAAAALRRRGGIVRFALSLDRPVIGLGAGAATVYPGVGRLLDAQALVPEHADVANAVGAVVGQVRVEVSAEITQPEQGRFQVLGEVGPATFSSETAAIAHAEANCASLAEARAREAGADEPHVRLKSDLRTATIEDQRTFIEARITAIAAGRPRIAA
ncbi:MAG TPA: hydantoinase/oxoprolinase family protein [Rhizobiaceae bacterium]|nr:hydantoinase/oxoprolinase family protein [Rhizobiaceae bacterium]